VSSATIGARIADTFAAWAVLAAGVIPEPEWPLTLSPEYPSPAEDGGEEMPLAPNERIMTMSSAIW
jgi:hypothetical protein